MILLFVVIYLSHSSMGTVFFMGPKVSAYIVFSIVIASFFYSALFIRKSINVKAFLVTLLLCCNIFATMCLNQDFTNGYYVISMCILVAFFISSIFNKEFFLNSYINILVFLATYSLIATYIFLPAVEQFNISLPFYVNSHGIKYYNMVFATPISHWKFYRNTGIFLEPGMYQVFLSYALIFEVFLVRHNVRRFNVIILSLASLSTFSPVAYLQFVLLLIAYLIRRQKSQKINKGKVFMVICIMTIALAIFINMVPSFQYSFIQGLDKLLNKESSYQGRTGAIIANIKSAFESPLLGKGISFGFQSTLDSYLEKITIHNTSSSTVFFMVFGIGFALIISLLQFFSVYKKENGLIVTMLVFLSIMIAVNSQLLLYNQLFYILTFVCLMEGYNNRGMSKEF